MKKIPFNVPYFSGKELDYIRQTGTNRHLSGDGPFTRKCERWMNLRLEGSKSLLTHSGTAALEMAALLCGIQPGDEVVMPSFAFVSTANAFVLRGAVPVFVDIRPDTLNIDEAKIEKALTSKTKAVVTLHYAGVSCEMDAILQIAKKRRLFIVEDAAHGFLGTYKKNMLGSMGDFGAFSFHETKSIISGEGGALTVRGSSHIRRAEIIREKGTDRSRFLRGEVDKYTWRDIGSSYLPSDLVAAFLYAQLEASRRIIQKRRKLWERYHEAFEKAEDRGLLRRPTVPPYCRHNGHLYYLILPSRDCRKRFLQRTNSQGVNTVFHYIPLHLSKAGRRYGRTSMDMKQTQSISERLVRLPIWIGMEALQERVIRSVLKNI